MASRSKNVRGIIGASQQNRYGKITGYAQKLGLDLSPAKTQSGEASRPVRLEGEAGATRSPGRQKKLLGSLARRTSTSSRKRAVKRLLASQYGVRSG